MFLDVHQEMKRVACQGLSVGSLGTDTQGAQDPLKSACGSVWNVK